MRQGIISMVISGVAALLLPSCSDLLGDIYDGPVATSEYGFVKVCTDSEPGLIYINATDYTVWTYIDFEEMRIDSLSVSDPDPAKWDFAVHRYDAKTNNAKVFGTSITDLNAAKSWKADGSEGVSDIWSTDVIVTDMSTMMDGYLSYVDSWYNPLLSEWLDVDTSVMPPIYTLSNKVYIIESESGKKAAVKLVDFMNSAGVKGYMSIEYIYPL